MKKVLKFASIALSAVMLVYVIIMLLVEGFSLGLIPIAVLGVAFMLCGLMLNKIPKVVHVAVACVTLALLTAAGGLAAYGSNDNVTYSEDVIIVLGKGLDGDRVLPDLANRLDKAVEYYEKNPDAIIVVSGGKGSDEKISEAIAMERYLLSENIPAERIIKEDKSTSTHENFMFSNRIIEERLGENYTAAFVTNKFHIFRAEKYAQEAGVNANHLGADTQWHSIPANYMREIFVTAVAQIKGELK